MYGKIPYDKVDKKTFDKIPLIDTPLNIAQIEKETRKIILSDSDRDSLIKMCLMKNPNHRIKLEDIL